ncbi:MAG: hypothetical protein P1V51_03490 [Deltaproteobacteria bacterium]|nr:hypothetical protein [Deltaproteobacteria bacterium]
MKTRRVFDVAVLGGSTGALVAACLLRKKGYKVVHVEHDGLAGLYHHAGRALPVAPEFLPLPRRSPVMAEVLDTLSLVADSGRLLRALPALQILTPGRRFSLPFEPEKQRAELSREFGEELGARAAERIAALLHADAETSKLLAEHPPLPPDGLFERRALKRLGDTVPDTAPSFEGLPELETLFAGLERLGSYLHTEAPSPLQRLRSVAGLLQGVVRGTAELEPGGYASLLRRRFESLGGVRAGGNKGIVESIGVKSGRIDVIEVLDDNTEYHPRFVVSGLEVAALRRLLPLDSRRRKFDARLGSVRPRELLFSLNLVLKAGKLPLGLADAALYLPRENGALDGEVLLLERFPEAGGEGEEVLQISTFVPASRREQGRPFFEQEEARLLDLLRSDLLPFLDEHLVATSAPILEDGESRGSRLNPWPRLETDLGLSLGVGLLPPSTPYKNLILAGRENVPGLGLEGEFLAGHRAARLVAEQAKRHDPLKGS